jgi:RNA polymerase sigma-70 factor (ECF subfamily)
MMQEHMHDTDAQLVERTRKGDAHAFEWLVRRHLRTAHLVALSVVGEPADAEDICQDAFIAALERLDDCRHPDRFLAWLLQIVRNHAYSLHRSQRVRRALPLEGAIRAVDHGANPAGDAARAELRERLTTEIQELSEVQREVLLLHDLEGWRHREIAELLGLPEGTVRAHLSYARRNMRERLGTALCEE